MNRWSYPAYAPLTTVLQGPSSRWATRAIWFESNSVDQLSWPNSASEVFFLPFFYYITRERPKSTCWVLQFTGPIHGHHWRYHEMLWLITGPWEYQLRSGGDYFLMLFVCFLPLGTLRDWMGIVVPLILKRKLVKFPGEITLDREIQPNSSQGTCLTTPAKDLIIEYPPCDHDQCHREMKLNPAYKFPDEIYPHIFIKANCSPSE